MRNNEISYSIGVEALLWEIPVNLTIGQENGKVLACGTLQWGERSLSELIEIATTNGKDSNNEDCNIVNNVSTAMSLIPKYKGNLTLCYKNDLMSFGVQDESLYFKAAKAGSDFGILFQINMEELKNSDSKNVIYNAIYDVADVFGLAEMSCYFQTGERNLYEILLPKTGKNCKNSIYLEVHTGHNFSFYLKGAFELSFLENMLFHVNCGIEGTSIAVEAYSTVKKPIRLIGPFGIGNACLKIQLGSSNRLGMYANFYIGNLQFFAAMILDTKGSVIQPRMLSAAVSDISISVLVTNLIGKEIDGIGDLDFVKLEGLKFNEVNVPIAKKVNVPEVVSAFNQAVREEKLTLIPDNVQITPTGVDGSAGYDMTDLRTMRHYFISKEGKVKLTAQFYYSDIDTTLGEYTVSKGVFICAALTIFGFRLEALFSYREDEGILAYTRVPLMKLAFMTIGPANLNNSSMELVDKNTFPIPTNSVLAQILPRNESGAVFFLSATKTDISFYIDGGINILGIFDINARIYFSQGIVSIDIKKQILGLTMGLHLSVNYQSFTNGSFEFEFILDSSELTKKLESVKRKLEEAARKVHEKIKNAKLEIEHAKDKVNGLYREIDYLDDRISGCRRAIKNARWWKKAFVAIAMGIEIAAFEVAKGAVYASIKVAQAALEVAKGIVALSGYVSEGVLLAAKAVVEGAMSVFYIKSIHMITKASTKEQYFKAKMEFIALGKEYKIETQIGHEMVKTSSIDKALESAVNKNIAGDLDEMEKISRSNWSRYQKDNLSIDDHTKRLSEAQGVISSSMNLMIGMQEEYWNEFHTTIPQFDRANLELQEALIEVQNIYETGMRAGDMKKLSSAMGGLKRQVSSRTKNGIYRDEQTAKARELIGQYDEARAFYDEMNKQATFVMRCGQKMDEFQKKMQQKSREEAGEVLVESKTGDIKNVIRNTENIMYREFPVNRSGERLINLSREPLIRKYFEEAYKENNIVTSEDIVKVRNRSRKGDYKSRL